MPKKPAATPNTENVRIEVVKATDIQPDDQNANKGTLRGEQLLDTSLRENGAGRSLLLDKHGKAIAGNKTLGRAVDLGYEDVIVVHTTGQQLVAVMRDDLDLDSEDPETVTRTKALAIADNRVAQVNLEWDADVLASLRASSPAAVESYFHPEELDAICATGAPSIDKIEDEYGEPPDNEAFWPELKVKVSPEVYKRYQALQDFLDGDDESERFGHLTEVALTALQAETGETFLDQNVHN